MSGLAAVLVAGTTTTSRARRGRSCCTSTEAATTHQRAALETLFLDGLQQLPWIRKARHVIGVRVSEIEIDGARIRVGSAISVRATRPVETDLPVACGIPGYERKGRELYADEFAVDDDPFAWELTGNCAFESDFDYDSESVR